MLNPVVLAPTETDPTGRQPHEPGAKCDEGKLYASLLTDFALALQEVAKVCTHGAKKYSRGGWQHVPDADERYHDAKWRHILKARHEECDLDSGLPHEAHEIWNALARLELRLRKEKGLCSDAPE